MTFFKCIAKQLIIYYVLPHKSIDEQHFDFYTQTMSIIKIFIYIYVIILHYLIYYHTNNTYLHIFAAICKITIFLIILQFYGRIGNIVLHINIA